MTRNSLNLLYRGKTIPDILTCYPEMKSTNEKGKEVTEYNNKYWVMVTEAEAAMLYPDKDSRKSVHNVSWQISAWSISTNTTPLC